MWFCKKRNEEARQAGSTIGDHSDKKLGYVRRKVLWVFLLLMTGMSIPIWYSLFGVQHCSLELLTIPGEEVRFEKYETVTKSFGWKQWQKQVAWVRKDSGWPISYSAEKFPDCHNGDRLVRNVFWKFRKIQADRPLPPPPAKIELPRGDDSNEKKRELMRKVLREGEARGERYEQTEDLVKREFSNRQLPDAKVTPDDQSLPEVQVEDGEAGACLPVKVARQVKIKRN
jgi:hypothetical protein